MTLDPVPDSTKTLPNLIGRIFHPAILAIPTLVIALSDLGWAEALRWGAITLPIILLPGMLLVLYLRTRGRHTYQRKTRTPLYITAWCSVVTAAVLTAAMGAPRVLTACLLTLALWLPIQLLFNTYVTKISTHAGVAAGCMTGLFALGKLPTLPLQLIALGIVVIVALARVSDRNHTLQQVTLGILVGAGSVLLVFPLVLRG
jgi:membrane-associated phospholipid phosphatase